MALDPKTLRVCLVTDRGLAAGRSTLQIVEAAVRGGATMVQLREKAATSRAFLDEARALKSLLAPLGVPLIVNDRLDIALAVDADGVHVGQDDLPVAEVRRILGPHRIVGLSISNADEIMRADASAADYLGIGPVYRQTTKSDAAPSLEIERFRRLCAMARRPVVAIGGLTPANSALALAAGADGLAIVSAIVSADDPEIATRSFSRLYDRG